MTDDQALSLRTKMLGATVREARQGAGKSIRESAELIGTSPSTFSSYEHGRKGISLPELEVLAYEYQVSLSTFWANRLDDEDGEGEPSFDAQQEITLRQKLIGAQLRKQRHEADMTIAELAEAVDFPASRVSAYERGERSIPLPELELLARTLGHDLEEYVDLDGPIGNWIRQRRQFRAFLELPDDLRSFVAEENNRAYLRLAKDLSKLPREQMLSVRRSFEEITP